MSGDRSGGGSGGSGNKLKKEPEGVDSRMPGLYNKSMDINEKQIDGSNEWADGYDAANPHDVPTDAMIAKVAECEAAGWQVAEWLEVDTCEMSRGDFGDERATVREYRNVNTGERVVFTCYGGQR